ncbi:signal peptide peptidase A. Serine peptidase. MEROPS family S49 [Rhizobiales bacterium GAS188]|nr:signal peptide peptidase A. Serine peptidase. MEROPS family S49 [Rhizobiales bacterium GAS188]
MSSDAVVERRYLRRRVTFWRIATALLAIIAILVGASRLAGGFGGETAAHIARVKVSGLILDDAEFTRMLDRLAKSNAKAVILDIDSPGGGAAASEEIYEHLRKVGEKRPIVAVDGSLAASGGYIVSLAADHIFARNSSAVGSIGVIFQNPNVTQLLTTVGVKMEVIKSSPLKASPNPFEATPPEATAAMAALVGDTFAWFKNLVRERRHLDEQALAKVADGRVFAGAQALSLKLIDGIGGEDEALAWLKSEKGIDTDLPIRNWTAERGGWLRRLTGDAMMGALSQLGLADASKLISAASGPVRAQVTSGLLVLWQPIDQ